MLVLCVSFSNAKTKSLFIPWRLASTKWFKFAFCANNSGFARYSFQLIVLLKPDFKCGNNFELSWVDKVTTGTWRFVSVNVNVEFWFATLVLIITKFPDHVKISSTSQLIKGISRVLQKLLKYFSGTIISTFSMSPSSLVLPIIFDLKLSESVSLAPLKITIPLLLFTAGISLQYCHILPDVF